MLHFAGTLQLHVMYNDVGRVLNGVTMSLWFVVVLFVSSAVVGASPTDTTCEEPVVDEKGGPLAMLEALLPPGKTVASFGECELQFSNVQSSPLYMLAAAMDKYDIYDGNITQWFHKYLDWNCLPTAKKSGMKLIATESDAFEIEVDLRHPSFSLAAQTRKRFDFPHANTMLIRVKQRAGLAPQERRMLVHFEWYGRPMVQFLDTAMAFNWLRFTGSLAWARHIVETIVTDYTSALLKNGADINPTKNAATLDPGCALTYRFLDLAAGSGYLGTLVAAALQVLLPKNCVHVVTSDISETASIVQQRNIDANGLGDVATVAVGDMFTPLVEQGMGDYFDSVMMYPPQVVGSTSSRCERCGPHESVFLHDLPATHFFSVFEEDVRQVLRKGTSLPTRRAFLGVDPENLPFAANMDGFFTHGSHTFIGHASDLVDFICTTCDR